MQILATVNATLTVKGLLLKQGTVVDATLIAAPISTKNSTGTRDPEMHQTKKGNQWHFGMKAHIGSDADLRLVHSLATTAANAHDITQAHALLHGQETDVFADAGYWGIEKREEIQAKHPGVDWHIAMMPGKRKALDKDTPMGAIMDKLEQIKASTVPRTCAVLPMHKAQGQLSPESMTVEWHLRRLQFDVGLGCTEQFLRSQRAIGSANLRLWSSRPTCKVAQLGERTSSSFGVIPGLDPIS